MKVLVSTIGSHGDVLPFIGICKELMALGHEVVFYVNPYFAPQAQAAGLTFKLVGDINDYETVISDPKNINPFYAAKLLVGVLYKDTYAFYDAIKEDIVDKKDTLLITSPAVFGARMLGEKEGIHCNVIHLAPFIFRSNDSPARLLPIWIKANSPLVLKKIAWTALDTLYSNPIFSKPMHAVRRKLGLPPIKKGVLQDWITRSDSAIGMYPEWFSPQQPDWNQTVYSTGFPLDNDLNVNYLPDEVEAFLAESTKPVVVITSGTAAGFAHSFFKTSVAACKKANVRAILLTHFDQVPKNLPKDIKHFSYIAYSALLPRVAAFIHHGGIGATSMAMACATPQIIRPYGYDQYDNAEKAMSFGVATEILPISYRTNHVASVIKQVVNDKQMKLRCNNVAENMAEASNGIKQTCQILMDKGLLKPVIITEQTVKPTKAKVVRKTRPKSAE